MESFSNLLSLTRNGKTRFVLSLVIINIIFIIIVFLPFKSFIRLCFVIAMATGTLCGLTPFLFRRKGHGIEVQLDMVTQFCSACSYFFYCTLPVYISRYVRFKEIRQPFLIEYSNWNLYNSSKAISIAFLLFNFLWIVLYRFYAMQFL